MDKNQQTTFYALQRYWMRDQADHAIFVRHDLTVSQIRATNRALDYAREFQILEEAAIKNMNSEHLIPKARSLVMEFISFQDELLFYQLTGRLLAKGYPTFRDHLIRESEYYLRLISIKPPSIIYSEDILFELVFWLRQMAEHALFIMAWADPYENMLRKSTQEIAMEFDSLLNKTRLFVSMMSPEPVPEIPSPSGTELGPIPPISAQQLPAVAHLLTQSLTLTTAYRHFLVNLKPEIEKIKILGVLTTLFMDHQTREVDYFIAILRYFITGDQNTFIEEYRKMPFKKDYQEEMLYSGKQQL